MVIKELQKVIFANLETQPRQNIDHQEVEEWSKSKGIFQTSEQTHHFV